MLGRFPMTRDEADRFLQELSYGALVREKHQTIDELCAMKIAADRSDDVHEFYQEHAESIEQLLMYNSAVTYWIANRNGVVEDLWQALHNERNWRSLGNGDYR